jgi:1,4-alpha-glucan branching enzyme
MMEKGYLALVLHAHLPYVRHPESEHVLEERWLFEAITETYMPLLQMMKRLVEDKTDFRLTMSLTPTLLSMLNDPLLQTRYLSHIIKCMELAEKEIERTAGTPFHRLAEGYYHRFSSIRDAFCEKDILQSFREFVQLGKLELITSAATHAFLPFVITEEAIYAQLMTAIEQHESLLGQRPRGIWLPECGYRPGLDRLLKKCGLDYFFVDSHGLKQAKPSPVFDVYSPVLTPEGVAVFARDPRSSEQVWSSKVGYPGDVDYREYYRDIGYDLDFETIKPYIHPDGIRINTGIKYYRITGEGDHKEPYNPDWAREKAALHAGHFLHERIHQVLEQKEKMGRNPIVVAPFDAELFGHWWYEGPMWIDFLLRKIHYDQDVIKTITPSEYLTLYPDYQVCDLGFSSWGRGGYGDVWLRGENDWIYPALHHSEQQMVRLANKIQNPSPVEERACNQAARELMLAQSSDWAFIMDNKTMVDYAVKRTKHHINRFQRLVQMIEAKQIDEEWLSKLERLDPIFPDINYRHYCSEYPISQVQQSDRPKVLMLSWEFPPLTIGGLSRHVYDLSRYLVRQGWEVHVITTEAGDAPHTEEVEGVHVHRVHVLKPDGGEFIHWVLQLNLMMIDTCQTLLDAGYRFDLIHAHDWMVSYAAKTLKHRLGLPLISTIHATEYGRNNGIHTDLQRKISHIEWQLTYESNRVIVCSQYMKRELEQIFSLPSDKLDVIPNGVDPDQLQVSTAGNLANQEPYASSWESIILFVGRLVREKGIHTLIDAAPKILAEIPEAKFVIVGSGPAMEELKNKVREKGLQEKVLFTGFISDQERNRLFKLAKVAVFPSLYEPFGIVALEAMAACTPVVVSDVGGLGDVVDHERNGRKMLPGNPDSLADQVILTLKNPEQTQQMAQIALSELSRYDWNQIARMTIETYLKVWKPDSQERSIVTSGESV